MTSPSFMEVLAAWMQDSKNLGAAEHCLRYGVALSAELAGFSAFGIPLSTKERSQLSLCIERLWEHSVEIQAADLEISCLKALWKLGSFPPHRRREIRFRLAERLAMLSPSDSSVEAQRLYIEYLDVNRARRADLPSYDNVERALGDSATVLRDVELQSSARRAIRNIQI